MVVAIIGVHAGETCIVFEYVVLVQMGTCVKVSTLDVCLSSQVSQCEECRVRLGVGNDGLIPHQRSQCGVEVQTISQTFYGVLFCDVAAVAGDEAVVGEGVHHWARTSDCESVSMV